MHVLGDARAAAYLPVARRHGSSARGFVVAPGGVAPSHALGTPRGDRPRGRVRAPRRPLLGRFRVGGYIRLPARGRARGASFLAQQLSRRDLIWALAVAVRPRLLAAQTRAARAVHPAQLASRHPRSRRPDFGDADSAAGGRIFPRPVPVDTRPALGGAYRRRLAARGHRARPGAFSHGERAKAGHARVGVVARKFARSRFVSSESTTRVGTVGRENCVVTDAPVVVTTLGAPSRCLGSGVGWARRCGGGRCDACRARRRVP